MGVKQTLPGDHIWPPDHGHTASALKDADYSSPEVTQTTILHLGLKSPMALPEHPTVMQIHLYPSWMVLS